VDKPAPAQNIVQKTRSVVRNHPRIPPTIEKLMLGGIQQYPDLLALLASDDAHECRATPRAGVVLLRFCIFHCA
jgi:hypothetical protein